ncbi:GGDEF domain-containing protein [Aliikangiella sp. IMCC44632]
MHRLQSFNENNVDTVPHLWLRSAKDIVKRSKPGILVYPVFWPLIAYGSNIHNVYLNVTFAFTLTFLFSSLLRVLHIRRLEDFFTQRTHLWHLSLYLTVLPQSFSWGLLFALALYSDNSLFTFLMAFSSAGLVAGGSNSFSPIKALAYTYNLSFMLPALLVAGYTQQWIVVAMLVTYSAYMLNLAKQQHFEYWRALSNEYLLAQQSRTDALTQLPNRRSFDEKLEQICRLYSRGQKDISLLLIDCDHFKSINDSYGHDFGDRCLKVLAQAIKDSLPRTADSCYRFGGEEFCVILPATNLGGASKVAERVRQAIEDLTLISDQQKVQLTVSIGSVSFSVKRFTPNVPIQMFKVADEALYEAKKKGRNMSICTQKAA